MCLFFIEVFSPLYDKQDFYLWGITQLSKKIDLIKKLLNIFTTLRAPYSWIFLVLYVYAVLCTNTDKSLSEGRLD